MTKTLILAAALLTVPTLASAETRSFTRDGVTYSYDTARKGDATIITGNALPGGANYKLTVRGKRVSGHIGGKPVAFAIEKPLAPAAVVTASAN